MSTDLATETAQRLSTEPVTQGRVIRSEWIKFTTLRSTISVLSAALIGMVVIALVVGYNTRHLSANLDANDVVASSPLQGYYLGQLLIGSLGVLFVTGEYSTGMIRATMTAVPRRTPVVWAKLAVFIQVTLVPLTVASIVAFLAAEGFISRYRPGYSLADPGALRVVIGTGVYLTFVGLIGTSLGWIVRSTPGALVSYLAVILVIPVLFGNVFGHWGKEVAQYLPSQAGSAFINTIPDGMSLHPWPGIAVMTAWVVAFLAIAVTTVRRRDV